MTELFVDTDDIAKAVEGIANPLEHLVGEGKKFKTNEDLAKGKLYSDLYVPVLQLENEKLKQKHDQLEAELASLKSRAMETANMVAEAAPSSNSEVAKSTHNMTQEQLDAYIESKFSAVKDTERRTSNVAYVRSELEKNLGEKYGEHMQKLADEYGKDYLAKMAEENPKAFLKLA